MTATQAKGVKATGLREKLARFDRQSDTYAKAAKQPWECGSYAEFVASLPDDEQPDARDAE